MKRLVFTVFFILAFFVLVVPAKAAEVVGYESHEVSWQGIPASDNGDKYQLYYGQANGNHEEYSIYNGLDGNSHSVTLTYLKPCTLYSWSLKSRRAGVWTWVIRDARFDTQGTCGWTKPTVSAGASMVTDVTPKTTATTTKTGSSTISWSPKPNATGYNIYYRTAADTGYVYALRVPGNSTMVTINALTPGVKYFYRVAAVVDGRELWYSEKVLQEVTGDKPVLGATTMRKSLLSNRIAGSRVLSATSNMMAKNSCSNRGQASVSIRVPGGVNVQRTHVLFGTEPGKYVHALRNLDNNAREVSLHYLDTCATYYYQVEVVGIDGRTYWQGEQVLHPSL